MTGPVRDTVEPDVDVLVLGSGIAGGCAALAARDRGADVLVLEPADVLGGHARLSTGFFMASASRLHEAAGVEDPPERLLRDYLNLNRQAVSTDAVRTFAETSGATVDWLVGHGVRFHDRPLRGGNATVSRSLVAEGFGAGLMERLWSAATGAGVQVAPRHRALELITDDGCVVGCRVATPDGEQRIRARSVVLATGGFEADPELLAAHYPSSGLVGDWLWNIGHEHNRGDGLRLARGVGARLVGHDHGLRVMHANFVRTLEATLPGWLVLVDAAARRYVDETSQYGMVARRTDEVGGRAWAILDARAIDRPDDDPTWDYAQQVPGIAERRSVNFSAAMLTEQRDAGRVAVADTIEELAAAVGLPTVQLAATVRQYNHGARTGRDAHGKQPEFLRPIDRPPYLAVEMRPASLVYTAYGPAIDGDGRVLNELGDPIPGLFAAGEVAGGVLGELYVGSGSGLGTAGTLGRAAGLAAAGR